MEIIDGTCAGYCEVRNYYFYGQEVRSSPGETCRMGEQCQIQLGFQIAVEQQFQFNIGLNSLGGEDDVLKGAFDLVSPN